MAAMRAAKKKRSRSGTKSLLANSNAKALLEAAAEAVDITVEQLVSLAHDAGALVAPPKEGQARDEYTLQDLGERLWMLSASVPVRERPQWFAGLTESQQVSLVTLLRHKGFSSLTIANDFGIEVDTVKQTFDRFADNLGLQVVNVRLSTIVGQIQLAAERAAEGAMSKDDWTGFWRIQREAVEMLQSLGIVDKAIHRSEVEVKHTHDHEHRVKFDEQTKAEIDRIVQVELKRKARQVELKQVEAIVLASEPMPAELQPGSVNRSMSEHFEDE